MLALYNGRHSHSCEEHLIQTEFLNPPAIFLSCNRAVLLEVAPLRESECRTWAYLIRKRHKRRGILDRVHWNGSPGNPIRLCAPEFPLRLF